MARWRIVVHALDRTGPPILALTLAEWMARRMPEDAIDLVAFRGGALEGRAAEVGDVRVLLHDEEAWDASAPDPQRCAEIHDDLVDVETATATLLVSVAAGQALPFVRPHSGPIVGWVVEQGDDMHWLDDVPGLVDAVDLWIAGSAGSKREMDQRGPGFGVVDLVGEFVSMPEDPAPAVRERCRGRAGAGPDQVLVMGAGIGTHRKGSDLFVQVADRLARHDVGEVVFAWIGGERDDLLPHVKRDAAALGLDAMTFVDGVDDIEAMLASADVFLHTARLDSFPLVCLHAAAAGTPVVAFSGAGGVPEMMGESFVGASFPDVAGLATEVGTLFDPVERRRVGTAQRQHVREHHGADSGAPRVVEALRRVALERGGQ